MWAFPYNRCVRKISNTILKRSLWSFVPKFRTALYVCTRLLIHRFHSLYRQIICHSKQWSVGRLPAGAPTPWDFSPSEAIRPLPAGKRCMQSRLLHGLRLEEKETIEQTVPLSILKQGTARHGTARDVSLIICRDVWLWLLAPSLHSTQLTGFTGQSWREIRRLRWDENGNFHLCRTCCHYKILYKKKGHRHIQLINTWSVWSELAIKLTWDVIIGGWFFHRSSRRRWWRKKMAVYVWRALSLWNFDQWGLHPSRFADIYSLLRTRILRKKGQIIALFLMEHHLKKIITTTSLF